MTKAKTYFSKVQELFELNANRADGIAMSKYMRNLFPFYGIKRPIRKIILKEIVVAYGIPEGAILKELMRMLWNTPQRDLHMIALEFMEKRIKKCDDSFLNLIEELLPQNAWWDSIDFFSPRAAGPILQRYPELIPKFPDQWIKSNNFWFQRAAILFQLKYKSKTDTQRLFRYIKKVAHSNEFFLQKGSGWALREYSKTNPEAVQEFVENNQLSPLTIREGLRLINK